MINSLYPLIYPQNVKIWRHRSTEQVRHKVRHKVQHKVQCEEDLTDTWEVCFHEGGWDTMVAPTEHWVNSTVSVQYPVSHHAYTLETNDSSNRPMYFFS